ncbi:type IV pilin protein [Iodobacter sp.]|uniref:type IV pilin protein n=1 Tax=Iodobacter sp. TaxID=1915058 RepID=UPI0025F277F9|nr:prepilin-type N-terminal cleavage/methylation domain-containing protein [Iodobacter sp.]
MKKNGFTLIEMMIVVAIIAILASIAVPSYQRYIRQAAAKSAAGDLVSLSLYFEQKLQRNLSYGAEGASTSTEATKTLMEGWNPSRKGFVYTTSWTPNTYTLSAKYGSTCTITLKQNNDRTATGADCGFTNW